MAVSLHNDIAYLFRRRRGRHSADTSPPRRRVSEQHTRPRQVVLCMRAAYRHRYNSARHIAARGNHNNNNDDDDGDDVGMPLSSQSRMRRRPRLPNPPNITGSTPLRPLLLLLSSPNIYRQL